MEILWQDLRYGARMLARKPGFTAVAALTIALGIGANTAIFSFADLLLRRPIALPDLNRLAAVREQRPERRDGEPVSPANFLDWREQSKSFESLAAYQYWTTNITGEGQPEALEGIRVTPNFFATLGVRPAQGRTILSEEGEPGRNRVVVVSDGFWRRRFGMDPNILGRSVQLDGQSFAVVGVMPRNFSFPLGDPDLWVPLAMDARERSLRGARYLTAIGRLKPGVTLGQARAEMQTIWRRLEQMYPDANAGRGVRVVALREQIINETTRQFVLLLVGAVGFVLLIACANVANLQLARAAGRQREIALRAALGASRWRVLRQLLTESVLLSTLGAALGLIVAIWGVDILRASMPADVIKYLGDWNSLAVNARALAFTLFLAVLAGVVSGLAPAWQTSRADLNDALKEGSGRATRGGSHRFSSVFVVAEVALALVLLVGASLMVKGFAFLLTENPRLEPEKLLTFRVTLPEAKYREPHQRKAFYDQALERLQALPDVQSAAVVSGLPYSFHESSTTLSIEGRPAPLPGQLPTAMPQSIGAQYFRTMRIPVREGRQFDERDTAEAPGVAIVSESMAQRLWPGESPIGKRLKFGSPDSSSPWLTIAGVVGDVRHDVFERSYRSTLYRPYQQEPPGATDFVIRSSVDPMDLLSLARGELLRVDKDQPILETESLAKKIYDQATGLRYAAVLMALFGALALVLSAVGVYGVMAYSVAERRHEIGIRIALGAGPSDVVCTVMGRGILLTASGWITGMATAFALARLLASIIYGVSAWDAMSFTAAPLFLFAVALAACYIPSRLAPKVDPIIVVRYE